VIPTGELSGRLDDRNVLGSFDDTDDVRESANITAYVAFVTGCHVVTASAQSDLLLDVDDCLSQPTGVGFLTVEKMKRQSLSRLSAYTR
jgi:hypothetical protein